MTSATAQRSRPGCEARCSVRTIAGGRRSRAVCLLAVLATLTSGCWYYSFTGAAIPSHLETIAIPLLDDVSRSAQPNLAEELTELLIDRFVRQTRLSLADDDADASALLVGRIERYRNDPVSVTGEERASLNRVTIGVSVSYTDQVEDAELLNRSFTAFGEYDPLENGFEGEIDAATEALEKLAGDIFTSATSNW